MGQGLAVGIREDNRRRAEAEHQQWLNNYGLGRRSPMPMAPPRQAIPTDVAPSYAPPQVQVPSLLPNPQPQGLGGMPLIRDRMMSATLSPFGQPNWGVPQVNPQYLTQMMPTPNGALPADAMMLGGLSTGIGGAGAPQLFGYGGPGMLRIPRRPLMGAGTA